MRDRGISLPWDLGRETDAPIPPDELDPTSAAAVAQVAEEVEEGADEAQFEWGRADEEITTRIDVSAHLDAKRRSMDCHRTQRQDLGWMLELPDDLGAAILGTEYYVLRWLDGADVPSTYREAALLP
jgi:LmbE family N-acetylglucosaminyl deacetylase